MVLAFAFGSAAMVRGAVGYTSGIRPQAGGFSTINRALAAPVKVAAKVLFLKVTFALGTGFYRPRSRSSTSEEANPSAGAPMEAWNERSASRVWPPSWPSGVDRKSTRLNSSHLVISYAVFCLKKKHTTEHHLNMHVSKSKFNHHALQVARVGVKSTTIYHTMSVERSRVFFREALGHLKR